MVSAAHTSGIMKTRALIALSLFVCPLFAADAALTPPPADSPAPSATAANPYLRLAQQKTEAEKQICGILWGVKDKESADAAAVKVSHLIVRRAGLHRETVALGNPTEAQQNEVDLYRQQQMTEGSNLSLVAYAVEDLIEAGFYDSEALFRVVKSLYRTKPMSTVIRMQISDQGQDYADLSDAEKNTGLGENNPHLPLMKKMHANTFDLVKTLQSVQDKETAEAAAVRIQEIVSLNKALQKEDEALGKPTEEQQDELYDYIAINAGRDTGTSDLIFEHERLTEANFFGSDALEAAENSVIQIHEEPKKHIYSWPEGGESVTTD